MFLEGQGTQMGQKWTFFVQKRIFLPFLGGSWYNKTKVESVQLGKILDSVFPPSPRPRVKCCGWNGECGKGREVYSLGLDLCGFCGNLIFL